MPEERASVIGGVDQALKLLKTDYIDIVHLHSCSKEILERGDVILALEDAKQAGKIRVMAYSGENEDLDFAISMPDGSARFRANAFYQRKHRLDLRFIFRFRNCNDYKRRSKLDL